MNKKLFKLLRTSFLVAGIYLLLQALILVKYLGVFSIVEEVPVEFKKTNQQDIHLLKNQKAIATFKASENHLGVVLVQLVKFGQGGDQVVFRIKKEGEEKWHHESKFRGDQVKNNQYFPLGFPPMTNSKNNVYVFELESLAGEYNNGVGVIKDEPSAVMYKYSAGDIKNYKTLLSFTSKKFLYVFKNINYWQVAAVFVISSALALFIKKKKITAPKTIRFLLIIKNEPRRALRMIIDGIKSSYLSQEKTMVVFLKKATHRFTSTNVYLKLLNTNTKKRILIGLLIFLLALTYRFSSTLVNQHLFFYAGLGGQGDYDQFIRAATCALNFCSYAILGQNFLLESSILGIFYKIFGFTGGLKAYVYLMIIFSSIVATLAYLLLSKKSWITIGGIIGSLFLATSDFLTNMSLNFPPDNGSLFTFSMFFVVYFLTLQAGTIRWLLFFGLMGTIDGLNKALFLISDLAAFIVFAPVFFYEKARETGKSLFRKKNIKILFLSSLPLLIFLIIYSAWEYFVQLKFSAPYFLRGLLLSGGKSYISYTSFADSSLAGNILSQLLYLSVSAIVMVKRLIDYTDLQIIFLAPIFLGLVFFTFVKRKFPVKKFILTFILSVFTIVLLLLIRENYNKIHQIFSGEYISGNWKTNTYVQIFLLIQIIILFILNFKYAAIKLSLPIIPYIIMLIILTKNSPFPRISIHVVAWSIILLAFLIDFLMMNINKCWGIRARIILGTVLLVLFIYVYISPKMVTMTTQLNSGLAQNQDQIKYLRWAEEGIPRNALILAGGKSDLVILAENIKRPIVYNTLWSEALLIKPNQIPGIKPTDFNLVRELKNRDNFKKNKYLILEDDVYIWRGRATGVADNVFSTASAALHANDYSIKVYKYNPDLKKAIYELNMQDHP